MPDFRVIVELGQPEQAPLNSKKTLPLSNFTKLISPPSWATAGLTLSSISFFICSTTLRSSSL